MAHYDLSQNENIDEGGFWLDDEEEVFFEMANLHKSESGLPYNIWLDSVGVDRDTRHNLPRLKVDVDGDGKPEVPVSIDRYCPQVLEAKHRGFRHEREILNWVKEHYEVLIDHWEHKLTDKQALFLLSLEN